MRPPAMIAWLYGPSAAGLGPRWIPRVVPLPAPLLMGGLRSRAEPGPERRQPSIPGAFALVAGVPSSLQPPAGATI